MRVFKFVLIEFTDNEQLTINNEQLFFTSNPIPLNSQSGF